MSLDKLKSKIGMQQAVLAVQDREGVPQTPLPLSNLEDKIARSKGKMGEYAQYAEITRIVRLPIVGPLTKDEKEEFDREHILAEAYHNGFRLFDTQANGLLAYELYGGLFGPIGVGWGKTLLTLMIANAAYMKGIRKMLLLVPPEVLGQLVETDIRAARTKVPIGYPIHVLGGRALRARRQMCASDKKGLYIMPYSLLSTKDTDDNLSDISPELIIADEAHRIANRSAARTRRMVNYIEEEKPECVFVSGTITAKSVMDYYHLIRAALKSKCPLPLTVSLAHEWGAVIDSAQTNWGTQPNGAERTTGPGPIMPLVDWARKNFPEEQIEETTDGFRKSFRLRLTSSPGVVASGEAEIGTSLTFANRKIENYKASPGWSSLQKLIAKVNDEWLTPNDDEIEHAIHTWKWLYELSAGFYNELAWPEVPVFAQRRGISASEAQDILDRAKHHHAAGQEYAKELRSWLQRYAKPRLDTPFLIGADMSAHKDKNVGTGLYTAWKQWKDLDFEGRPDRDSRAVRICPFKIEAATTWAKGISGGAILWVYHQEIGSWLHESLLASGIDAVYCPAGTAANAQILDPANADRKIVASITAHGTGKNLQHFQHQCFVQWPRSAKIAEQTLGRLHRNGQKADELEVRTINTLEFDEMNFAACLNDSLYIHQSTGVRQKLIFGSYDPVPRIFPPAVLRQRGADGVKMLNEEQQRLMQEKFGQ